MKLFVYGLLRSDMKYASSMYQRFTEQMGAKLIERTRTEGKHTLVAIHGLAFLTAGHTSIVGELYEVPDDKMEYIDGWEFAYERKTILLIDGSEAQAYCAPTIVSGDYSKWYRDQLKKRTR